MNYSGMLNITKGVAWLESIFPVFKKVANESDKWLQMWDALGGSKAACIERIGDNVSDPEGFCVWLESQAVKKGDRVTRLNTAKTEGEVSLKIASEELHIVWGEVYIPDIPDSDGDFMDEVTVRNMAYQFMRDKKLASIDIEHNNVLVNGATVVESFVARENDPDFIPGSWVVGMYVPDDVIWDKIKKREINGFSIEALVKRSPVEVEIELPPVISGVTKQEQNHSHKFYVSYDSEGNFLGGRTDDFNGHYHDIKRGTITEKAEGHNHLFAYVDELVAGGSKLMTLLKV
jgi:hypothetical protein